MKKSHLFTLLVVLILVLVAPAVQSTLFLNLGLIVWNKMIINDTVNPKSVLALLTSVKPRRDVRVFDWVLGHTYWLDNQRKQAIECWHRLGAENVVQQMISVSDFLTVQGDINAASVWLAKAASLDRCLVDVWLHHGQNAELAQDMQLALVYYEKALTFSVTSCDRYHYSDVLYRMGTIWYHRMSPPNAEKAFDYYEAAMLYGDFHDSFSESNNLYQMAHILFRQNAGDDQKVISLLTQALEINPDHSWANWLMGITVYRTYSDFDRATNYILRAWQVDKESHWFFCAQLGELYETEGQIDRAAFFYQCALDRAPDGDKEVFLERLEDLTSR